MKPLCQENSNNSGESGISAFDASFSGSRSSPRPRPMEISSENIRNDHVHLYFLDPVVDKLIRPEVLVAAGSLEDYRPSHGPFNHQEVSIEDVHQSKFDLRNNSYEQKKDNSQSALLTKKKISKKVIRPKSNDLLHNPNPVSHDTKEIFTIQCDVMCRNNTRKRTKDIICDNCKETFDNQSSYYFHRSSHINENGLCSWLCAQCNENFYIENDLRDHEVNVHGEIRPYPCPYCLNSFLQYNSLNDHIHRYHHKEKPHKCTYCEKSFYRPFDLKTHIEIHLGIKKHNCPKCGLLFSHSSNLTRHLRTHTGFKPYICPICSIRFTHINTLRVHEMSHNKSVTCSYCLVKLQSKLALKKHITLDHNDKGIKNTTRVCYCFICGKSFKFKKEMKLHVIKHHNVHLNCSLCNNIITSGEGCKNHACMHLEASRSESTLGLSKSCEKKMEKLTDNSLLDRHRVNDYVGTEINSKPICDVNIEVIALDSEITDDYELSLSIESVESKVVSLSRPTIDNFGNLKDLGLILAKPVPYKSDVILVTSKSKIRQNSDSSNTIKKLVTSSCEQEIFFGTSTNVHWPNIENINLKNQKNIGQSCGSIEKCIVKSSKFTKDTNFACKQFKCSYCLKTFGKKWNYLQHMGIHDESLRIFHCNECNLSFSYKASYRAHCQSHVNTDMRYNCSHCPKSYKTKDGRYQHEQRFHSKLYNYHCETCNQGLFSKANYTYHLRLHQKEFPYTCFACDKKFAHVSNLKRHERIHTGERPHKCPQCPKAFIQAVSLRNHLKTHDNDLIKKHDDNSHNTIVQSGATYVCHAKTASSVTIESPVNQEDVEPFWIFQ